MIQDHEAAVFGTFEGVETEILFTGSTLEGLDLPTHIHGVSEYEEEKTLKSSDLDSMLILKNKQVCDPESFDHLSKEGAEVMEIYTEGIHPGYLQVRLHGSKLTENSKRYMFIEKEGDDYLYYAPEKVKEWIREKIPDMRAKTKGTFEEQGPALTSQEPYELFNQNVNQDRDFVFPVFCCPIWPNAAKDWPKRERTSNWPNREIVEKIISEGCHIVPVCHSHSKEPQLEWRMSFSVAELTLMHNISRSQRQCYLLLKTLHSQELKEPKALVTYHLKTLFLWMCEMIPPEEWNPDNIGPCLMKMLDHLYRCLKERNLPSYFIPENNLIDRIPDELCDELASRVEQIRQHPLRYLFEFNNKYKWFFGLFWVTAEKLFQPILEDAKTSTSLKQSHAKVFFIQGCLHAINHLLEHGALLNSVMEKSKNPDPGSTEYKLPYDNALDILEDVLRLHKKVTEENMEMSQLAMICGSNICQYTDCLIGFYERFLERYPEDPNKGTVLGNLGCCYHVKYLRPLCDQRKLEMKDLALEAFKLSLENGASPTTQVDFSLFLCAIQRENDAAEHLKSSFELLGHEKEGENIPTNMYVHAELLTLDDNIRQISDKQGKVSLFSFSLAAYLLVKLSHDKEEQVQIIKDFESQCKRTCRLKDKKAIEVGNAFVLLGYACELAGFAPEAQRAQAFAREILHEDKLPALHVKPKGLSIIAIPRSLVEMFQGSILAFWQRITVWLGWNR